MTLGKIAECNKIRCEQRNFQTCCKVLHVLMDETIWNFYAIQSDSFEYLDEISHFWNS